MLVAPASRQVLLIRYIVTAPPKFLSFIQAAGDFFWGLEGGDGEVILHPGDLITLPTHMFRGFENITAKH